MASDRVKRSAAPAPDDAAAVRRARESLRARERARTSEDKVDLAIALAKLPPAPPPPPPPPPKLPDGYKVGARCNYLWRGPLPGYTRGRTRVGILEGIDAAGALLVKLAGDTAPTRCHRSRVSLFHSYWTELELEPANTCWEVGMNPPPLAPTMPSEPLPKPEDFPRQPEVAPDPPPKRAPYPGMMP